MPSRTAACGSRLATPPTLFDLVRHEGAEIRIDGDPPGKRRRQPHRAGHALAAAQRQRLRESALGYAPRAEDADVRQWLKDPFGAH